MDVGFVDLPPPIEQPVARLTLELTANEAKYLAKLLDPAGISNPEKKAVAEAIYPFISQYDI